MPFNIKTKKILSEENCKRIIMLGISIRDKLENAEKGLISEYDETVTYTRGMSCYYDGYLYKCLYTTTGIWDSNKWEKVGDELSLIDKQTLASMINLSDEEIASLQSLISTEIRLDKCFSSSDTYNRILNAENNCKTFTLEQLAKKMGASYKVVTTTSEVTSTEFLYLISNGTAYDIYALIDGVATKLGDTTIDLSQFYTKEQIDNDFLKKTDADGKYTTQTSFNNHTSDTDIHTSATEKASYVKKTDITTTIDSSSTNDTVPSARATYESKKSSIVGLECPVDKSPLEFAIENNKVGQILYFYSWENRHADTIYAFSTYISIGHLDSRDISLISIAGVPNSYAVNKFHNGAWLGWEIISKSKIADIDKTAIELTDTTHFEQFDTAVENGYQVKNGICYVNLNIKCNSTTINGLNIKFGMPKPNFSIVHGTITPFAPGGTGFKKELTFSINSNGVMTLFGGELGCRYLGTFSYPVAEQ